MSYSDRPTFPGSRDCLSYSKNVASNVMNLPVLQTMDTSLNMKITSAYLPKPRAHEKCMP